jgi:threonine dehydrogenase-like Zn-dependent dehydrogenase
MILGHESSGRIIKVGSNVKHVKEGNRYNRYRSYHRYKYEMTIRLIGDRVTIEPGVPCRRCDFCKLGRYNLCADVIFLATPPVHGSIARYHTHAADFCYK